MIFRWKNRKPIPVTICCGTEIWNGTTAGIWPVNLPMIRQKRKTEAELWLRRNAECPLVSLYESTPFLSRTYTYGNSQWLDQLTGWDNHTISYDEAGNPLNWYSGEKDWSLSWEGKTLVGASSASGDTITFSYDMDGQRSRKVVNGVTHQYLMQGTKVVYDACNGHCLEFIYDNVGQPYGRIRCCCI